MCVYFLYACVCWYVCLCMDVSACILLCECMPVSPDRGAAVSCREKVAGFFARAGQLYIQQRYEDVS